MGFIRYPERNRGGAGLLAAVLAGSAAEVVATDDFRGLAAALRLAGLNGLHTCGSDWILTVAVLHHALSPPFTE